MAKKIIGLVVALAMVFSMAVCTVSASAFFSLSDIVNGAQNAFENSLTGRVLNAVFNGSKDDDAVVEDGAAVEEEETTKFKPLFDFYIDYDVVKTLKYGFEFGNVPETTTEEITEPIVDDTPAVEETTEEEVVSEIVTEQAPVEITEETPLADVEQIANTGDAGVATIVALSAVSAAAFVVAKKK